MDSPDEASSVKNRNKLDREEGKPNNANSLHQPRQHGLGDETHNAITIVSNPMDPSNSRIRNVNTISVGNCVQSCSKSSDYDLECNKNLCGASQAQKCKNVNNTDPEPYDIPCSKKLESDFCDNGIEVNCEVDPRQRLKTCVEVVGHSPCNAPSTSGTNRSCDNTPENIVFRESRKRPSSLKLNKPNLDAEDSSSDTGNDEYSLGSEDGCIYTYRGGEHLADLPSSFFSLDMGLPLDRHLPIPPNYQAVAQQPAQNAREQGSRASSPDMDFLEMDFDPGPSCEVDTGDESTPDVDLEATNNLPEENEPVLKVSPEPPVRVRNNQPVASCSRSQNEIVQCFNVPSTSKGLDQAQGDNVERSRSHQTYGPYIKHVNARGEQLIVRRTMTHWSTNAPASFHVSSGDLVSPKEMLNYEEEQVEGPYAYQINQGEHPAFDSINLSSALYNVNMAKKLMDDKIRSDIEEKEMKVSDEQVATTSSGVATARVPRSMVWSEREACERQVTQIGTSACGATAVVNVFIALGVPVNIERINAAVGTRQRANNAPLPRYIMSRAVAGCTAAEIVAGLERASDGLVTARFFPTYPERAVSLSHWLADWISLGAVPILTLNLQVGCPPPIPDAWHHQMVFGVSSRGIYLCNPVSCEREATVWARLTTPSELLVRARDVVARFTPDTDLTPLMSTPDPRFHTYNVFGQVVNVLREWRAAGWAETGTRARHVRLPAAYRAGVTVAALTGSEGHRRLLRAAPLPLADSAHADLYQ